MKDSNIAPFFACAYVGLSETARKKGYALAIHGSLITDMDLVAIPWTEEAESAEAIMEAIKEHLSALDYRGRLKRDCSDYLNDKDIDGIVAASKEKCPEPKPHGRIAWNLYLYNGVKIDLSVMPRRKKK